MKRETGEVMLKKEYHCSSAPSLKDMAASTTTRLLHELVRFQMTSYEYITIMYLDMA